MGVVYRAHDERLDRDVALKILPPGVLTDDAARKRFRKEALALAKLNSPNIAAVYDFDTEDGVDFLVMEYVRGVTLATRLKSGALAEKEVLMLGEQIAKTLEEAHESGIVHRDLKPGNVMVTVKGQVKVLDFGLAKLLRPIGENEATQSGAIEDAAGTLPYMAPEQLRGEQPDIRTDIYAAGVTLYEMATGRRPFEAKLSTALVTEIAQKPPLPPGRVNSRLSPKLEDAILKCLEKDPDNRYQSARELAVDLRRLQLPSTASLAPTTAKVRGRQRWAIVVPGIVVAAVLVLLFALKAGRGREWWLGNRGPRVQSLAVLPLENFSHDPAQDYFADGMTDALITELAQISALRVISRTSVMEYKSVKKPLPQIARELNVDAILEGSVWRSEGKVRITAQLVQATPERHLWAKSYERNLRDIMSIQSEVAQSVAEEIRIKLSAQEQARLQRPRLVNPEAHDAYLRGRYYWNKGEPEDVAKAREYFEQALEKDPQYAPAYTGLADYYSVLPFYTNSPPDEVFPKAKAAVAKALELDDSLAEAHASRAYILTYYDWNWADAGKEFQRALALNPNDATVHHRYSRYLSSLGRVDEALREIKRAQELDPLSLLIKANVGVVYYFGRNYDSAIDQLRNVLKENQEFSVAHWGLGLAYAQQSMQAEAIAELERADALSKHKSTNTIASLGYVYAVAGQKSKARKVLEELQDRAKQENISSYQFAVMFAGLHDRDRAFEALEKAFQERSTLLTYLKMDPRFDSLRPDPRFQDLLRRIGLAQ